MSEPTVVARTPDTVEGWMNSRVPSTQETEACVTAPLDTSLPGSLNNPLQVRLFDKFVSFTAYQNGAQIEEWNRIARGAGNTTVSPVVLYATEGYATDPVEIAIAQLQGKVLFNVLIDPTTFDFTPQALSDALWLASTYQNQLQTFLPENLSVGSSSYGYGANLDTFVRVSEVAENGRSMAVSIPQELYANGRVPAPLLANYISTVFSALNDGTLSQEDITTYLDPGSNRHMVLAWSDLAHLYNSIDVQIEDASSPDLPDALATVNVPQNPYDDRITGQFAKIDGGLEVSNPAAPVVSTGSQAATTPENTAGTSINIARDVVGQNAGTDSTNPTTKVQQAPAPTQAPTTGSTQSTVNQENKYYSKLSYLVSNADFMYKEKNGVQSFPESRILTVRLRGDDGLLMTVVSGPFDSGTIHCSLTIPAGVNTESVNVGFSFSKGSGDELILQMPNMSGLSSAERERWNSMLSRGLQYLDSINN